MGREQAKREPALARALARVATDQPHEQGHDRERDQQQQGRAHVDRGNPREHDERDDRGEHDLGQVPAEVRLEPVDALNSRRGDLAGFHPVQPGRLRA